MNVLLIAATSQEIAPFIELYRRNPLKWKERLDIDILITGVGLLETTYTLSKHLRLKRPQFMVQAGVAGCFDPAIPLGLPLIVKQDTVADETVIQDGKLTTLFELQLKQANRSPYKEGWLVNPGNPVYRKSKLKKVKSVSVNQVSSQPGMIMLYKGKFGPVLETMEGSAFHYICLAEKIPFIQLRTVSNYTGERDKKKWKLKEAIDNLNIELTRLFDTI